MEMAGRSPSRHRKHANPHRPALVPGAHRQSGSPTPIPCPANSWKERETPPAPRLLYGGRLRQADHPPDRPLRMRRRPRQIQGGRRRSRARASMAIGGCRESRQAGRTGRYYHGLRRPPLTRIDHSRPPDPPPPGAAVRARPRRGRSEKSRARPGLRGSTRRPSGRRRPSAASTRRASNRAPSERPEGDSRSRPGRYISRAPESRSFFAQSSTFGSGSECEGLAAAVGTDAPGCWLPATKTTLVRPISQVCAYVRGPGPFRRVGEATFSILPDEIRGWIACRRAGLPHAHAPPIVNR